jgi:pimeloyl-ACP methyl ester carboxylesterase
MLVPLLNPKFANVPAAKSCELRVRGTTGALDGALCRCHNVSEQRVGMTQVSRGVCKSDDAEIAYLEAGDDAGEPIVLVHGFASTKEANWVAPGWIDTFTRAGRRAIALDNRGHGESTKFYDPARYHTALMAEDVRAVMDHLGLERADVMGYSMGARTVAFLALAHPDRVRSLVLGGLGIRLVGGVGLPDTIADALEAPSITQVTDPQGYAFRAFAQQTKSDLKALAACIRGSRQTLTREQAGHIAAPTLIAVGTKDPIAGSAQELAALMPNAVALDIPGRDHMLAVGDKVFKSGVLAFLEERA